jgi:polyhydroxyalkanoate synthesis regulator phasin
MTDIFEKAYLAGLGAWSVTKEKAKEIVDDLVEKGKITADEAPKILKEVVAKAEESKKALEERVEKGVENTVNKLNLATKTDVQRVEEKLDLILKELQKKK